ncbi:MAG: BRCT domain-containing protein [Planctomycetota bacterium]
MRIRERGMGNMPFIIVIVLLVLALALWFLQRDDLDKAEKRAVDAESQRTTLDTQIVALQASYDALAANVGLAEIARDGKDLAPTPEEISEKCRSWLEKMTNDIAAGSKTSVPGKAYQVPQGGTSVTVGPGEPVNIQLYGTAFARETITFRGVLEPMPDQFKYAATVMRESVERTNAEVADREGRITGLQGQLTAAGAQYAKDVAAKQTDVDSFTTQLGATKDSLTASTGNNDKLTGEFSEYRTAAEKAARKAGIDVSQWKAAYIAEKQTNQIALKEDPKDGEVVEVGETLETVWIDRGRADRLGGDTTFVVWRPGKGNMRENVAEVRVINVLDRISEARIIRKLDPRVPVTKGMNISNPFYDPKKQLTIHVWGDLKSFPSEIAEKRLAAAGCRVSQRLDHTVNVVVVGEPPIEAAMVEEEGDAAAAERKAKMDRERALNEVITKARSFGAIVVSEDVLRTFVKY